MRGPAFPTAVDTGTPVSQIPCTYKPLRQALARQAVALEKVAVAAESGDVDRTLRAALSLASARRQARQLVYTPSYHNEDHEAFERRIDPELSEHLAEMAL